MKGDSITFMDSRHKRVLANPKTFETNLVVGQILAAIAAWDRNL